MRALVQRVSRASVSVDGRAVAEIGPGMLVLLGVADGRRTPIRPTAWPPSSRKLRIFDDAEGRMNEPLGRPRGALRQPVHALGGHQQGQPAELRRRGPAEVAEPLYERFCDALGAERGVFGARMSVELVNDGPVTLLLEA